VTRIAVTARSFARNQTLRAELQARYPDVSFTDPSEPLTGERLTRFLRGHDGAIVGTERVDAALLAAVPELRVISKYGVGLDNLDLAALARHHVRLGWTPGVNRRAVAELTLMFAVALLRRVPESSGALRAGRWNKLSGRQLTGRTIGIIGCGHIGKDLVRLLAPFECRILAYDIKDYAHFYQTHRVTPVSLDELLAESEVVTLHVPLDDSTRGMMNRARLAQMRPGAWLINTARGGLVDEAALVSALKNGHLAGAAMDVFEDEPAANAELVALPTFLGTPHIGGSSEEAQLAMGRAAIEGLETARPVGEGWPGQGG
jgi:D-3-phosphoglycerate dehydrogenase